MDITKIKQFLNIFQNLKGINDQVNLHFRDNGLYFQCIDTTHICIIELMLDEDWFYEYDRNKDDMVSVGIITKTFAKILNIYEDGQSLTISYDGDVTKLNISFNNIQTESKCIKHKYNKQLLMSLIECDIELLNFPEMEYDIDITIHPSNLQITIDQLSQFDEVVTIKCSESMINFGTSSFEGDMNIEISDVDLIEYQIVEGLVLELDFSIKYLKSICNFSKVFDNLMLNLSKQFPLKISHELDEHSQISFYLAPKIIDDE